MSSHSSTDKPATDSTSSQFYSAAVSATGTLIDFIPTQHISNAATRVVSHIPTDALV